MKISADPENVHYSQLSPYLQITDGGILLSGVVTVNTDEGWYDFYHVDYYGRITTHRQYSDSLKVYVDLGVPYEFIKEFQKK